MEWLENDPEYIWKFRDLVISKISLIGLVQEYGLKLEPRGTGQFTHRGPCPFHKGKDGGRERTPSFFISQETNTFYCFGCTAHGTVIDFVSLIDGAPIHIALTKLAKKAGLIDKDGKWDELQLDAVGTPSFEPLRTIEPYLFEISAALRAHIKKYVGTPDFDKEFRWTERVAAKVDGFLSTISYDNWEYARDISISVQNNISKRNNR